MILGELLLELFLLLLQLNACSRQLLTKVLNVDCVHREVAGHRVCAEVSFVLALGL